MTACTEAKDECVCMSNAADHRLEVLAALADTVVARSGASPDSSYTAKLLSKGTEHCAKKFGEEAVETALAAMTGDKAHITSESADALYHLLVLLSSCDVPLQQVMAELESRFGVGGLKEKAARGGS